MSTLTGEPKDPVGLVVQYLLSLSGLTDLVDKRIYGGAVPPGSAEFDSMVTVRPAGGPPEMYQEVLARPRFEVRSYATTDEEAGQIHWKVYTLLNGKNNILISDGRILAIWSSSGGSLLYDQVLNRPFMVSFYDSIVQLEAISA